MPESLYPYEQLKDRLVALARASTPDAMNKAAHKGYKFAVEHAEEMAVHLSGDKPEKILKRVRPREDPETTKYRLESYEPTTKSTAVKALTIAGKVFNPALGGVKPTDGAQAKELYDYAMINYPVFNSVVNFLSQYGLKKTMEDPNGVFLIEPGDLPTDPYGKVDVTKRLQPVITCFHSRNVHLISPYFGLFFIRTIPEDLKVTQSNTKKWIYKFVDSEWIYDFALVTSDSTNYTFEPIGEYNHQCGTLPFWNCGGTYDQRIIGLFESYMYPAVPHWNKAISAESDLDGALIAHMHPQKWEVAEECEFVEGKHQCERGLIFDDLGANPHKCPSCGGSGRKSVKGPYSIYQVSRDKLNDAAGNSLNQPPAGYLDVPVAPTQFLAERRDKHIEDGLSALAMDILNEIGANQSGEAKAYDRTELADFLQKIADLFYDKHLVNIFYFFAKYMFIGKSDEEIDKIEPTVIKPTEFDIYTTAEHTTQLKAAKDSNINPAYIQVKQVAIQNKEFQQHPELLPYLNLTVKLDPLSEVSRTDVGQMVLDKSVSKVTTIIHDNIREFVRRALEEDKGFGDKEYIEQMEVMNGFADERLSEIEEESKVELEANMAAMIDPNAPVDEPAGISK